MNIKKKMFKTLNKVLNKKNIYITNSLIFKNSKQIINANFDYIRYSTLSLCIEEIRTKNLKGDIAELGVYKGDFAKRLNFAFPEKKLYLFDTFNGFAKKDIKVEQKNDFSTGKQDFSETSVELVLSKMSNKEQCIPVVGIFPNSLKDVSSINENFAFVSLDADLYEPTIEGLRYFYPRLEKGGYIFIHDYNNDEYKGAKQAVREYTSENNIPYCPIADGGGSVIISK